MLQSSRGDNDIKGEKPGEITTVGESPRGNMSKYKCGQDLDNTTIRLKKELKLGRTEGESNRDISDYITRFNSSHYSGNENQRGNWRGYINY